MTKISRLVDRFRRQVNLPWNAALHGAERTWFVVYDPADERRLMAQLGEFKLATREASHEWRDINLTGQFEKWLAGSEYREAYFEDPEILEIQYRAFEEVLVQLLRNECTQGDNNTVFAITGVASVYGFVRVASLVEALADQIRGRLVVFFPGAVHGNTYRLLNARDGWNYRSVVITEAR